MVGGLTSALAASPAPCGDDAVSKNFPKGETGNEAAGNVASRSSGKGRRRRMAAEQRRLEQQRWTAAEEDDEDVALSFTPSSPGKHRRSRKALRRRKSSLCDVRDDLEDYLEEHASAGRHEDDGFAGLEMALAMSLSLVENISGTVPSSHTSETSFSGNTNMSYENLVELENVRVVASESMVTNLCVTRFGEHSEADTYQEVCPICQAEFVDNEFILTLPCNHCVHEDCGKEWLLKYSKSCPICKLKIDE